MSEREKGNSTTWKAVSTLEYKKKQKAPKSEPKGFGAILGEAQNVVTDKWTAAGNLVPSYLNRLTEIQIQDEAYIHQQLVKPDEVKPKRGLQQMLSKGKGRGVRLLRSGVSRKVRFNDDGHGRPSGTGSFKPDRPSGTEAEQPAQANKNSSPAAAKTTVGFSSSTAPAAPSSPATGSPVKSSSVAFAPSSSSTPVSVMPTPAQPAPVLAPPPAAEPAEIAAGKDLAAINSTGSIHSSNGGRISTVPRGSRNSGSSVSGGTSGTGLQDSAATLPSQLPPGHAAPNSSCFSGDGGIMAKFLNQQYSDPVSLGLAPYAAGNSSGPWDGSSRTSLADKQLELLRSSTAPPPTAPEDHSDSPMSFRPLAIPEEVFARWSSAAGGTSSSAAAAVPGSSSRTPSGSRPPSRPRVGGAEAAGGSGGTCQQHSSSRRASASNIPFMAMGEQPLVSAMKPGKEFSDSHISSNTHRAQLAASASDSASSMGSSKRSTRTSFESVAAGAMGQGTSSKHWLTADYTAGTSSIEASSRQARKTGSPSSVALSAIVAPSQHQTLRPHSSSNTHAQYGSSPGALTGAGTGVGKDCRATGTMPGGPAAEHAAQVQRSSSPLRSTMASTAAAGDSSGSGRGSNLRGSRMSLDISSGGNPLLRASDGIPQRRTASIDISGADPRARRSGGLSWQPDSSASGRVCGSTSGGKLSSSTVGVPSSSGKGVQLPGIGRTQGAR